jgi:pilus assembly protein CpaE
VLLLPQRVDNVIFALRKAASAARHAQRPSTRARVVTVFSPKGGTGKTVTSTNLALAFAQRPDTRVLLLDLDLQFGDTAIMLGLEPEKTLRDLVIAPGGVDAEKLAGYTARHQSSVDVLAAPVRPEDAELVTDGKLVELLDVAGEMYDVIVVDTSPFFHGPMLAALDRTDELLLVAGPDVPALKNVHLSLHTLALLSFPEDRIRLILNRANERGGVSGSDVKSIIGRDVFAELPSDPAVPLGVNRGKPAVISQPDSAYSKALVGLAETLVPVDEQTAPNASPLTRLRLALGMAS